MYSRKRAIDRAVDAVLFEHLEGRRLLAIDTIQTLPFILDFSSDQGEILDKDGEGTGFTRLQENKLGNQYQPQLIDLDTTTGVLKLTTTGNSSNGGPRDGDNTLVNGLETQFDATTSGWSITARLLGPLTNLAFPYQQGGIFFGPDQDNHVKLVAVAHNGGQFLEFVDEQYNGSSYQHSLESQGSALHNIGSFAAIQTLDLRLVGDATTGKITAYYAINGGEFIKLNRELTLTGAKRTEFFSTTARAGIIAMAKNNHPPVTVTFDSFRIDSGDAVTQPIVTATRPAANETNVPRDAFVAADVFLPHAGAGIDASTLTSETVKLYRTSDGVLIPAVLNTSGGGDAIVLQPTQLLDPNTSYTFEVTAGLKDTSGSSFVPYTMTFITGVTGGETDPSLAFEKVQLNTAVGQQFTSLAIGPDGKLYASTITGLIMRFGINADGTLGSPQTIGSVQTGNGNAMRFITGIAFDPASTADNLILWVNHGQFTFENAQDWTGKLSRLTGANLENYADVLVGLPRSARDHLNNQIAFGPDGALYFTQGSNTAMGAPDNAWGSRGEHVLTAAVLRFDTSAYNGTPINVKTDQGGTYNPFAPDAPLTIYASGVRNAYDLLFHSNGHLYVPTNGSAANGNTPSTPPGTIFQTNRIDYEENGPYTGPAVPAITPVTATMPDYLFKIEKGGYYGHPNPARAEYVMNGGNPTANIDLGEVSQYPVGTLPDRNYRGYAYEFGKNYSPNGIIEYKGNAFAGQLNGKILVVRYSGGDDIIVLTPDENGDIVQVQTGIAGLTHFVDPLDLVEDTRTGYLYVSEYGGGKITLLRPITPGANITTDKQKLVFNDVQTSSGHSGTSPTQKIKITNTGTAPLALPADALSITGTHASEFVITQTPSLPLTLQPGESTEIGIAFRAGATGIRTAQLQIKNNDPDTPTISISLRGIGTTGTGGSNEPSLQRILDLHQIPINVGDPNPNDTAMPYNAASPNDEIFGMERLVKAGPGPVTIEVLASFGFTNAGTTSRVGYYSPGTQDSLHELFEISKADEQTVAPTPIGTTSFDPGSAMFSLYSSYPGFNAADNFGERVVFSEDFLNTWETNESLRHKVRFYQLKDSNGEVVPNAYVVAFEEFTGSYDYQDVVMIIRNVQAAPPGPEIGIANVDGLPYPDRLVFNRYGTIDTSRSDQKDRASVRIRNTGNEALIISDLQISGPWVLENPPELPLVVPAKGFVDIQLRFTANSGKLHFGTLTIVSNDSDEPTTVIELAGIYRNEPEANIEASLQEIIDTFGFATTIASPGDPLNQGGKVDRTGDEVLSAFWKVADPSREECV
jgi:glucose/arabinose dehydrogenase